MSKSSKNRYRILFFLLLGIGITLTYLLCIARIPFTIERAALWVPRFDYSNPEDVKHIIKNASEAGFTDVFFRLGAMVPFFTKVTSNHGHMICMGAISRNSEKILAGIHCN